MDCLLLGECLTLDRETEACISILEIMSEKEVIDSTESKVIQSAVSTQKVDLIQSAVQTQNLGQVQLPVRAQKVDQVQSAVLTQNLGQGKMAVPTKTTCNIQESRKIRPKGPEWTDYEDRIQRFIISKSFRLHESNKRIPWKDVALELNNSFYGGNRIRSGRNCSERWTNHLHPDLNSNRYLEGEWTSEEVDKLKKLYIKHKGSWSKISREMPGRTAHYIKNKAIQLKIILEEYHTRRLHY